MHDPIWDLMKKKNPVTARSQGSLKNVEGSPIKAANVQSRNLAIRTCNFMDFLWTICFKYIRKHFRKYKF